MSQKSKILGMLELGPVCGTRFLQLYMPRWSSGFWKG